MWKDISRCGERVGTAFMDVFLMHQIYVLDTPSLSSVLACTALSWKKPLPAKSSEKPFSCNRLWPRVNFSAKPTRDEFQVLWTCIVEQFGALWTPSSCSRVLYPAVLMACPGWKEMLLCLQPAQLHNTTWWQRANASLQLKQWKVKLWTQTGLTVATANLVLN